MKNTNDKDVIKMKTSGLGLFMLVGLGLALNAIPSVFIAWALFSVAGLTFSMSVILFTVLITLIVNSIIFTWSQASQAKKNVVVELSDPKDDDDDNNNTGNM